MGASNFQDLTSQHIGISFENPPMAIVLTGQSETPETITVKDWPLPVTGTRETPMGTAATKTWVWSDISGFAMHLTVSCLAEHTALTIQAGIVNNGKTSARLRSISMTPGTIIERTKDGGSADQWIIARIGKPNSSPTLRWSEQGISKNDRTKAMWAGFNMPIPGPLPDDVSSNDGRYRSMVDGMSITNDTNLQALVVQAVGPGDVEIGLETFVEPGQIKLDMVAEFCDVVLAPGETRITDEVLWAIGPGDKTMEQTMRWIAKTHGARVEAAFAGWCSWYDLGGNVNTHTCEATALWFSKHRDRNTLSFFQLDDGFQRTVGDWRANTDLQKFPGGLTPFVNAALGTGGRAGIWLAPLAVHESCDLFKQHPEWMQHKVNGELAGEANNWGPKSRWMDPTHPGAQQWLRELIQRFRSQGFTYFKIDFNSLEKNTRWHDPSKTRLQVFRDLYRLYREEIGEDGYLLNCGCFTLRGPAGFADAARIGPDSCATWNEPHPCCIRESIKATVNTAIVNGILFVNDPDVTYLRHRWKLSDAEQRTWHGFVGLLGGLTAISEPMHRLDYSENLHMWEMLNPPVPEKGHSLRGGADPLGICFGFTAKRTEGEYAVVQIYNPTEKDNDTTLDFADTGLAGPMHVWSFWDNRYYGIHEKSFTAKNLDVHGSMIVRLTPVADDRPIIIGSDLHIGCGAAEIKSVTFKENLMTIELNGFAGRKFGNFLLYSKKPITVDKTANLHAWIQDLGSGISRMFIRDRKYADFQKIVITQG